MRSKSLLCSNNGTDTEQKAGKKLVVTSVSPSGIYSFYYALLIMN